MQVSLAIMKACQPRLMEMREMEEMVEYLKDEVPALDGDRLQVSLLPSQPPIPLIPCPGPMCTCPKSAQRCTPLFDR